MNNPTRATVAGILAWGTLGAVNGAVIGSAMVRSDDPVVHAYGLVIGAISGAVLGIVGWYIRAALKKRQ
jgi:hypothetical protein